MIDIAETLRARGLKVEPWSPVVVKDEHGRETAGPDLYKDGKRYEFTAIQVQGEGRHEAEEAWLKAFEAKWPNATGTVYWRKPDKISHTFPKISESPRGHWHVYGLCVVL